MYIEWPDSNLIYNKVTNNWIAIGNKQLANMQ
jgi:hypothetical protein